MTDINTNRIDIIRTRLTEALNPTYLDIIDEAYQHVGHAGAQHGAGYYALTLSSAQFEGKTQVQNHQLVYKILGDLIPNEIHALKIKIK